MDIPQNLGAYAASRSARLLALWREHDRVEQEERSRLYTSWALDRLDADLVRCPACHEWRWRGLWLPCQTCGLGPLVWGGDPFSGVLPR